MTLIGLTRNHATYGSLNSLLPDKVRLNENDDGLVQPKPLSSPSASTERTVSSICSSPTSTLGDDTDLFVDLENGTIEELASLLDQNPNGAVSELSPDVPQLKPIKEECVDPAADAIEMEKLGAVQRARKRIAALLLTLGIELIVAFIINKYTDTLSTYPLLISFMPVISAVSGNVGLQSSSIQTRALHSASYRTTISAVASERSSVPLRYLVA